MFAPDDPILVPYRRLQRTFGQHEVVLAMYADKQLTTSEGVARLAKLAEQLRAIRELDGRLGSLERPQLLDDGGLG